MEQSIENISKVNEEERTHQFKPIYIHDLQSLSKRKEELKKIEESRVEVANNFENYKKEFKYKEDDIKQEAKKNYEDGYAKGFKDAAVEKEKLQDEIKNLLQSIINKFSEQEELVKQESLITIEQIANLSLAMASKISGKESVDENIKESLENSILENVKLLFDEPKINIYINNEIYDSISKKLENLKSEIGYSGVLELKQSSDLSVLDYRIDWNKGSLKKDKSELLKAISNICKNNY